MVKLRATAISGAKGLKKSNIEALGNPSGTARKDRPWRSADRDSRSHLPLRIGSAHVQSAPAVLRHLSNNLRVWSGFSFPLISYHVKCLYLLKQKCFPAEGSGGTLRVSWNTTYAVELVLQGALGVQRMLGRSGFVGGGCWEQRVQAMGDPFPMRFLGALSILTSLYWD